ncbi:hypothetical protein [Persephonella sp.]
MNIIQILESHKKRFLEDKNLENLDEMIEEIKKLNRQIDPKDLNPDEIKKIQNLISDIFQFAEKMKKETVSQIETSDSRLKGAKAYLKNT